MTMGEKISEILESEHSEIATRILMCLLNEGMIDRNYESDLHELLRDRFLTSHGILFPCASAISCKEKGILVVDALNKSNHQDIAKRIAQRNPDSMAFVTANPAVYISRIYADLGNSEEEYGLRCSNIINKPEEIKSFPLDYVAAFHENDGIAFFEFDLAGAAAVILDNLKNTTYFEKEDSSGRLIKEPTDEQIKIIERMFREVKLLNYVSPQL